jgi:hypothetical protein
VAWRVAPQALARRKERVREPTRRRVGRRLAEVCERLRRYLNDWKGSFHLAQIPKVLATTDAWTWHRLRALQPEQWQARHDHRPRASRSGDDGSRHDEQLGPMCGSERPPVVAKLGEGDPHRAAQRALGRPWSSRLAA